MSETLLLVLARSSPPASSPSSCCCCGRSRRRPTAAEQRLAELNARLDAMGSWLQNSHTQLQQTVNTRLDAVTQNLGESMKTIDQAHHRASAAAARAAGGDRQRAEEHHRSRLHGHLAAKGLRQQAAPRRLRPGPHGSDHRRRAAARRLRIPVHAVEQFAAGLLHLHAGQAASDHRCQIPARGDDRAGKRQDRRRAPAGHAPVAAESRQAHRRHFREISDHGRDAGRRLHVHPVGIDVCRTLRRVRRRPAERLPRRRHHRVAVAADAGDPGRAADPEGRAHARGRRQDSEGSRPA